MKKIAKYLKPIGIIFFITLGFFNTHLCYSNTQSHQNQTTFVSSELKNPPQPIIGSNTNLNSHRIKFLPLNEDFIEHLDVGFKKWIIIFENLKSTDLKSCEIMRLYSMNPDSIDKFVPLSSYLKNVVNFSQIISSIKIKSGKTLDLPYASLMLIFSEKGFLPGEKVTVRAKSPTSKEYETISFYPRPIVLHDQNGKELVGVELRVLKPTMYFVYFTFNPENRLLRIQSKSADETINTLLFQDEPINTFYLPEVINMKGGICSIILTYQNGNTYTLSLPWGEELIPFALGLK
jgi:hypothetical protein